MINLVATTIAVRYNKNLTFFDRLIMPSQKNKISSTLAKNLRNRITTKLETKSSEFLNDLSRLAIDNNFTDNTIFGYLYNIIKTSSQQESKGDKSSIEIPENHNVDEGRILNTPLTATQKINVYTRFLEIPGIEDALSQLSEQIIPKIPEKTPVSGAFIIEINTAELEHGLNAWLKQEYSPVDERTITNDERQLRRMDSLSRLLSLKTSLSACAAVTIDTSEKPQLIIAMNVGTKDTQAEIIMAIKQKLTIINDVVHKFSSKIDLIPADELEKLAKEHLVGPLFACNGCGVDPITLLQAATKFMHALCIDTDTFTPKQKDAFLLDAPVVILLPKIGTNGIKIQKHYRQDTGWVDEDIDLAIAPKKVSCIDKIHAEQLIVHYQVNLLKKEPAGTIGITKLCCATCSEFLQNYPDFIVRGSHGQAYQGVVNIATEDTAACSGIRRAPTFPDRSPAKTPWKNTYSGSSSTNQHTGSPHNSEPTEHKKSDTHLPTPPQEDGHKQESFSGQKLAYHHSLRPAGQLPGGNSSSSISSSNLFGKSGSKLDKNPVQKRLFEIEEKPISHSNANR